MEVLKMGFEKVDGMLEQGVEDTHKYRDAEKKRSDEKGFGEISGKKCGAGGAEGAGSTRGGKLDR